MAAGEADVGDAEQPASEACYSCQVISDGLPFALVGYLVYHTLKNRRTLTGKDRTKLYIINGLFTTSKCFLFLLQSCHHYGCTTITTTTFIFQCVSIA